MSTHNMYSWRSKKFLVEKKKRPNLMLHALSPFLTILDLYCSHNPLTLDKSG